VILVLTGESDRGDVPAMHWNEEELEEGDDELGGRYGGVGRGGVGKGYLRAGESMCGYEGRRVQTYSKSPSSDLYGVPIKAPG